VQKIANSSLHSLLIDLISSKAKKFDSDIISSQYCVSLASLSQILILFLKSALLLARFALTWSSKNGHFC